MALGLIFLRQRLHAGMCEACSKSRRRLQKKKGSFTATCDLRTSFYIGTRFCFTYVSEIFGI